MRVSSEQYTKYCVAISTFSYLFRSAMVGCRRPGMDSEIERESKGEREIEREREKAIEKAKAEEMAT